MTATGFLAGCGCFCHFAKSSSVFGIWSKPIAGWRIQGRSIAGLLSISEAAWNEARRRAAVTRCLLADRERRSRHMIQATAATLGPQEIAISEARYDIWFIKGNVN